MFEILRTFSRKKVHVNCKDTNHYTNACIIIYEILMVMFLGG